MELIVWKSRLSKKKKEVGKGKKGWKLYEEARREKWEAERPKDVLLEKKTRHWG